MNRLIHRAKVFVSDKVIKPVETIAEIHLKEQNSHAFTFHTKVPVKNPLCITFPIGKFTYSFKTGGREIGSGVIEDPGSLTARATTWLEVAVKIPFDILLSLMKDVAEDWDIDYELEVCLIFDVLIVGDISIPVCHSGEMKLPTMSSIADLLDSD